MSHVGARVRKIVVDTKKNSDLIPRLKEIFAFFGDSGLNEVNGYGCLAIRRQINDMLVRLGSKPEVMK